MKLVEGRYKDHQRNLRKKNVTGVFKILSRGSKERDRDRRVLLIFDTLKEWGCLSLIRLDCPKR